MYSQRPNLYFDGQNANSKSTLTRRTDPINESQLAKPYMKVVANFQDYKSSNEYIVALHKLFM